MDLRRRNHCSVAGPWQLSLRKFGFFKLEFNSSAKFIVNSNISRTTLLRPGCIKNGDISAKKERKIKT
jgi:hypothetical protein